MNFAVMSFLAIASAAGALENSESAQLHDEQCYSSAVRAAKDAFGRKYKTDWFVDLRSVVKAGHVRTIEVHIGPYDGTFGGSVKATYDCESGKLTPIEHER